MCHVLPLVNEVLVAANLGGLDYPLTSLRRLLFHFAIPSSLMIAASMKHVISLKPEALAAVMKVSTSEGICRTELG